MKKNKLGYTFTELLIVIIIIATILSLKPTHFSDYKGSKEESIKKACFSNLKVLQNAIEKYNEENDNKMSTLDQEILLSKKYISCIIEDRKPDKRCKYLSEGDLFIQKVIFTVNTTAIYHNSIENGQKRIKTIMV